MKIGTVPIFTIKTGKFKTSFICPSQSWQNLIKNNYRDFLSAISCNTTVILQKNGLDGIKLKNPKVIRQQNCWKIVRSDFSSESNDTLRRSALSISRNKYSFDSWFRIFLTLKALKSGGLLLHGAGISVDSGIHLFLGRSGCGKSTITKIIGKQQALSDEIVLIYKKGRQFFSASTPFWGELKKAPGKLFEGQIKGIYFLNHGKKAKMHKIGAPQALRKLLKTVLFFSKDIESINRLLEVSTAIIKQIPAYDFYFSHNSQKQEIIDIIGNRGTCYSFSRK